MFARSSTAAFAAPFVVFMVWLGIAEGLRTFFHGSASLALNAPQYWIYPAQTLVCGALLVWFRSCYRLAFPRKLGFTFFIAFLVLAIWICPQLLGAAPRCIGFDPTIFAENRALYSATVAMRFLRLVVVVPLLEETFWRGFLLRYLIAEDFAKVPVGAFSWPSFLGVALCFGLAHYGSALWPPGPDFLPALLTGALYNSVAYATRSLSSCILAHAATNLLLGLYIMHTRQWGFW